MADDDGDGFFLPTDAFVEVLLRLPMSSRRRFRLVSKRWRDLINERTPERLVRTKILAFFSEAGASHAVVLPDQPQPDGGGRQEWTFPSSTSNSNTYTFGYIRRIRDAGVVHLVGTCNGLLCLRDDVPNPGGGGTLSTISVTNPVTGEKAAILRGPISWGSYGIQSRKVVKYGFGYHPTTGKYKVVVVSCLPASTCFTKRLEIDMVMVLTVGRPEKPDSGWREVPGLAGPDSGYHDSGDVIVTVDGTAYWLTGRANRVAALDLGSDDERFASFEAPPCLKVLQVPEKATCQLTSVHGRLGMLVTRQQPAAARTDVWVLEGGGGGGRRQPRWSRRWSGLLDPGGDDGLGRWITAPHFTNGEYVLSKREDTRICETWLYRRKVGDLANGSGKNAELWPLEGAEEIIHREFFYGGVATFPYVETMEPLPISTTE
ncbi:unnamed protein product [Urochloa decumbens]|uniref:F-box domain-containing protein n=1 Tax=Urochloa decumbens TaxID=240449 RepID=A0ABC9C3Z8_9POAL